jgi:hypothetical protein
MPLNTREITGPTPVWEMYEAGSYIGIRNARTLRAVARVPLGPDDLDRARMIEQAPQMLDALELLLAGKLVEARIAATAAVEKVRGR